MQQIKISAAAVWLNAFTVIHMVFPRPFRPSVRPSVCLSHKRVHCDKIKKLAPTFLYLVKSVYPSFLTRRMVGGGPPLVPEILGQTDPVRGKKKRDLQSIITRSASAVTPSEKSSIITLLGSSHRAFQ